jgi:DNA-binding NarL/FixJ family response regulator
MPDLNGLEVVMKIKGCLPNIAFVICSTESDTEFVEAAFEIGVLGYVLKARLATDLVLAVKSAIMGRRFLSP